MMLASWLPQLALAGLYLQTSVFMAACTSSVAVLLPYLCKPAECRWWARVAVLLLSTGLEGLAEREREDALLEFIAQFLQLLFLFSHCQLSVFVAALL